MRAIRNFFAAELRCACVLTTTALICGGAFAGGHTQSITLEPITVKGTTAGSQTVESADMCAGSVEEIAKYASSAQVQARGSFGVQQDVSIRGSTFEDAVITIAGFPAGDPQTGHFSFQLPFTSADIESLRIAANQQSIDYIPKKPGFKGGLVKIVFGQHALWQELASINFGTASMRNRVSVEHARSNGGKPDTDFDISKAAYHGLWADAARGTEAEIISGFASRDFGAGNFYSSRFVQEEEHTRQRYALLRGAMQKDAVRISAASWLRYNHDEFILNRHNPALYKNTHATYVYGCQLEAAFTHGLFVQPVYESQRITSTNLGKHDRERVGAQAGIRDMRFGKWTLSVSGGGEHVQAARFQPAARAEVSYDITATAHVYSLAQRLWRQPSFTELYYTDPSNRGNDSLDVQTSDNFEWGARGTVCQWTWSTDVFVRRQKNTIDWAKASAEDVWQAVSAGDVRVHGFDVRIGRDAGKGFMRAGTLAYTYQDVSRDSVYAYSKYVFEYARHKAVGHIAMDWHFFDGAFTAAYYKPVNRSEYVLCDARFSKNFGCWRVGLSGTNIFNTPYWAMVDIRGERRWWGIFSEYIF